MEKKIPGIYPLAVTTWFDFYRDKTGQEYYFSAMDGKIMKQLISKVAAKVKQRRMELSPENIINSLKGFLYAITDKWILEHLELKNINSNFNSLYYAAVKNNPFTKSERLNDLVERKFSPGSKGATR